jgi:hypothetical protein
VGKNGLYKRASAHLHYEAFVNEALIEAGHLPAFENRNKKIDHVGTPHYAEPI